MANNPPFEKGGQGGFGFGTPFAEQLAFFRQKLNLPTERWDDIVKSAHDRAFIVAGAGKADLLDDLRRAMDKAQAHGIGLQEFRKDFAQIVFNRGWTGFTGDGSKAGIAWRTKVIYQTNMATSYAAGRWQQPNHPDLLKLRPYWRYNHADGVMHPRPHHLAWNGLTLPHDHPFWKTHFAPNGWGCHCYITAVDAAEYAKAQAAGKGAPPAGWDAISPKTGAPVGIDRGFDYAPGANVNRPMKDFIDQKLIKLSPDIAKALAAEVGPVLAAGYNNEMKLLNYQNAVIDERKLLDYALNPEHPVGGNKAGRIRAALGFDASNAAEIISAIRAAIITSAAIEGEATQWGRVFTFDFPLTGLSGEVIVRTSWIVENDVPRMTSFYVKES